MIIGQLSPSSAPVPAMVTEDLRGFLSYSAGIVIFVSALSAYLATVDTAARIPAGPVFRGYISRRHGFKLLALGCCWQAWWQWCCSR